jgi:ferrochelatase
MTKFDAVLVAGFGGPERREDVIPFLENVLRGKNVPRERMLEVAEHYYHFGGRSPINAQNRELIAALEAELASHGPKLPLFWGNRNWHPLLADTLRDMRAKGIRRAVAYATSAFGSYSGCRQYLEDIARAREACGEGAPEIEKLPPFSGHPGFIEAMTDRVRDALGRLPSARLLFTAHSIPLSMASSSPYVQQLEAACGAVAAALGRDGYRLAYQSRSGPPGQPWLEPDIGDALGETGGGDVVVVPIGFLSDHMEVLYDLDTEAAALCRERGIRMVRAATVGAHPRFISMIRELIAARVESGARMSCPEDCCPPPLRVRAR